MNNILNMSIYHSPDILYCRNMNKERKKNKRFKFWMILKQNA